MNNARHARARSAAAPEQAMRGLAVTVALPARRRNHGNRWRSSHLDDADVIRSQCKFLNSIIHARIHTHTHVMRAGDNTAKHSVHWQHHAALLPSCLRCASPCLAYVTI